ncbi:hypothetical protein LXA43DRAFT_465009 [Ganoderma leucocontextum]|nr:hypothetical protein LXA43DRAFT_465009 [Ganoderma leucocontextum]
MDLRSASQPYPLLLPARADYWHLIKSLSITQNRSMSGSPIDPPSSRALMNYDILMTILDGSYYRDQGELTALDLKNSALVCRGFSEPALRALWKTMSPPTPLWRLLAPKGRPETIISEQLYKDPERWERFQWYARFVRELEVPDHGWSAMRDAQIFRCLLNHNGRNSFTPSLQVLSYPRSRFGTIRSVHSSHHDYGTLLFTTRTPSPSINAVGSTFTRASAMSRTRSLSIAYARHHHTWKACACTALGPLPTCWPPSPPSSISGRSQWAPSAADPFATSSQCPLLPTSKFILSRGTSKHHVSPSARIRCAPWRLAPIVPSLQGSFKRWRLLTSRLRPSVCFGTTPTAL